MTTSDAGADESWGQLAAEPEAEREAHMQARYLELAALSEEERRSRLRSMAQAEYAMPDSELRPFTLSRLRVWLSLDTPVAQKVAASYDAIMNQMPGPIAMRRVSIVQTLAKDFPPEDEERLRALVPGVFAGQPQRATTQQSQPAAAPAEPKPGATAPRKRPWWAFWKK